MQMASKYDNILSTLAELSPWSEQNESVSTLIHELLRLNYLSIDLNTRHFWNHSLTSRQIRAKTFAEE